MMSLVIDSNFISVRPMSIYGYPTNPKHRICDTLHYSQYFIDMMPAAIGNLVLIVFENAFETKELRCLVRVELWTYKAGNITFS